MLIRRSRQQSAPPAPRVRARGLPIVVRRGGRLYLWVRSREAFLDLEAETPSEGLRDFYFISRGAAPAQTEYKVVDGEQIDVFVTFTYDDVLRPPSGFLRRRRPSAP